MTGGVREYLEGESRVWKIIYYYEYHYAGILATTLGHIIFYNNNNMIYSHRLFYIFLLHVSYYLVVLFIIATLVYASVRSEDGDRILYLIDKLLMGNKTILNI